VRTQKELGEIDDAFALALLVVGRVDLDEAVGRVVVRLGVLRAPAFFLVGGDEPLRLPRRVALLVEVHAFHEPFHEGELVLRIHDLEKTRQARLAVMRAQHAVAQPVERAHPHAARIDRQHRGNAREHFLRRLVRESDREEPVRAHLPSLYEPRDARGEHSCFAAAGPREDQRRLARQRYGFELRLVETCEKLGRHANRRGKTR
jgi:hypothetical protein